MGNAPTLTHPESFRRRAMRAVRILVPLIGLSMLAARSWSSGSSAAEREGARAAAPAFACPRASWRLADRRELRSSLLSLSHLLIRHTNSDPKAVPLSVLDWETSMTSVSRTRADALALAHELQAKLAAAPQRWGSLVREYSGDPVTRNAAGRLGLFAASEFLLWPGILDCLAPVPEGGYAIAESAAGIHIFRRDSVPTAEKFAAKRIVIGYQGADFLKYVARNTQLPRRSRAAALRIAEDLRQRARHERFDALVRDYSEHRDAANDGDIGVWSTDEPTNFPRVLDAIIATPVGDVTPVLDTELGFEIFLRTPSDARPRFAIESSSFGFEVGATNEARQSEAAAFALAQAYLESWRTQGRPSDARYRGNEAPLQSWSSGRGPHCVEAALHDVPIGSLVPQPLKSDQTYVVALRVEPPPEEEKPARVWLPAPEEPDLGHFVATSSARRVERVLTAVENEIDPSERPACEELRRALMAKLESIDNGVDRHQAWVAFQRDLPARVRSESALAYESSLKQRVRDLLIKSR